MKDLYKIISGDGFAMVLADHEGYILHLIGDAAALDRLSKVNCAPGFRWSERDVGTTSIALSIARKIPVQITETESFCRRGRGYTNSAAPIFDSEDRVLGTVATTTNTIRSYRSYTALYPQGRFTVEAENKISNLRTDKPPYEAALRIGSEASLKSFLTDYPGHQKESEVQQAAKDITEGRDIVDLLNDKKIEIATQGSGIEPSKTVLWWPFA